MHKRERNNEEEDVRDPKSRVAVTTILHAKNYH
jgi:hypothetical protein